MIGWLWYTAVVGAALSLAAFAAEGASRSLGLSGRWAWIGALAGSIVLPLASRLGLTGAGGVRVLPPLPASAPAISLPVFAVGEGGPRGPGFWTLAVIAAWGVGSAAALAWLAVSALRLRRARRGWRRSEVDGQVVLVSTSIGPAVVGWLRGDVVLPEWALGLTPPRRRMMLRHEAEHLRARDPLLLLAGRLLAAALPWSPAAWLQLRRLRLAVELDCDARVLRADPDVRGYGGLLLEVGRRHRAPGITTAALSEPKTFLELRLEAMLQRTRGPRLRRAAMLVAAAAILIGTAMCAQDPTRVPAPRATTVAAPSADTLRDTPGGPTFTPFTVQPTLKNREDVGAALIRYYPPLLKDAGIGGMAGVWLFVDADGEVAKTTIGRSSGHAALDSAALAVARTMVFTPALNRDRKVPVWIQLPIVFGSN